MPHTSDRKEKEQITYISDNHSKFKHYRLPIVTYFEDGEFIAECPLFYVSSHSDSEKEALLRFKEALELYLSENIQDIKTSEMEYTEEEIIQKARKLFFKFSSPGEEPSEYKYQEIDICI